MKNLITILCLCSFLFSDIHYITEHEPIGILRGYQTIFLTNDPELSDIIVVVDFNTIKRLFSNFSIYEIIIEKYNSQNVEKLIIEKIKDNGEVIHLSNGSVYRVLYDYYITKYWYKSDSVYLIDNNTLIRDDETVDVYKIK